ncbi:hypothetical protein RB597_010313 [Gaeumannomyces tritici]
MPPPYQQPDKWAVLIGVESYLVEGKPPTTRRLDGAGHSLSYEPLEGCVNDVLAVEEYLVEVLDVPPDHIDKLLAPRPNAQYIRELDRRSYADATYASIVQALGRIPEKAKKGDLVYIHYSGHGARATTVFADARKADPSRSDKDEALVPSDILYGGRYLRDLELAVLMQDMASAGLVVTASLDCCYSGGALRGSDGGTELVRFRGVSRVYESDQEADVPDPTTMCRIAHWASQPSWFTSARGFVVMAACLDTQQAAEHNGQYGLFTYWMLHSLRNGPLHISSDALFERIRGNIQSNRYNQTPQMFGDWKRSFFGSTVRSRVNAHVVSATQLNPAKALEDQSVVLNGGKMHGVEKGSEYAILKYGRDPGLGFMDDAVACYVRVFRVGARESYAVLVAQAKHELEHISPGCSVLLVKLPLAKRFAVRFHCVEQVAENIRKVWRLHNEAGGRTWLKLKSGDEGNDEDAAFSVSIKDGKFIISDVWGTFTPAFNDCLSRLPATSSKQDLDALIRRLEHLARFSMTRGLSDPYVGTSLPLISITAVEPARKSELTGIGLCHPASRLQTKVKYNTYEVEEKSLVEITFHNHTDKDLYLVVLNCGAEFSVHQVCPSVGQENSKIQAGQDFRWYVGFQTEPETRLAATQDGREVVDRLKVFASPIPLSLNALEIESLDEVERMHLRGARGGDWSQDFRQLLMRLESGRGAFRAPPSTAESMEWQVLDLLFQVKPGDEPWK